MDFMYYKLSNIASKDSIEKKFHVTFEFPNLYKTQSVIEGLKESTLSIITLSEPDKVSYAIWGLLPESFEDNWSVFQDVFNTLNVKFETLQNGSGLFNNIIKKRRCAIIATGFYSALLSNGTVEQCHVHLPTYEPFAIAGVFNELNDGFLTCTVVVTATSGQSLKEISNIANLKPLVLNDKELKQWLNSSTSMDQITKLTEKQCLMDFSCESIDFNHPKMEFSHNNRNLS